MQNRILSELYMWAALLIVGLMIDFFVDDTPFPFFSLISNTMFHKNSLQTHGNIGAKTSSILQVKQCMLGAGSACLIVRLGRFGVLHSHEFTMDIYESSHIYQIRHDKSIDILRWDCLIWKCEKLVILCHIVEAAHCNCDTRCERNQGIQLIYREGVPR